jgi:hypothetical protein
MTISEAIRPIIDNDLFWAEHIKKIVAYTPIYSHITIIFLEHNNQLLPKFP